MTLMLVLKRDGYTVTENSCPYVMLTDQLFSVAIDVMLTDQFV